MQAGEQIPGSDIAKLQRRRGHCINDNTDRCYRRSTGKNCIAFQRKDCRKRPQLTVTIVIMRKGIVVLDIARDNLHHSADCTASHF